MDESNFSVQIVTMQNQPIGDLRIKVSRTKAGKVLVKVRLLTAAEIRWHSISLPAGTPAYALYEQCAQEALRKFAAVTGAVEVAMQTALPV